ncbi:hypothetical protein QVE09_03150 [Paenibacillus sp. ClWae2A]|nr:hypothetical protein [Paenibacillus sp. ClWae2A]MDT9717879.1 hypothetical protein [Paenibacillus sp. ClWae2A]
MTASRIGVDPELSYREFVVGCEVRGATQREFQRHQRKLSGRGTRLVRVKQSPFQECRQAMTDEESANLDRYG